MKNYNNFNNKPNPAKFYFAHLVGRLLGNPTKGQDFSTYTLDEEAQVKWRYYKKAQAEALSVLDQLREGCLPSDYTEKLQKWGLPKDAEGYEAFVLEFPQFLEGKIRAKKGKG